MRRLVLALVCILVALLATAPASARVAPLDASMPAASRAADSRLGLSGDFVYCTYRFALREPRLASGNGVVGVRLASDLSLRWKGRPLQHFGGTEVYDMRARQWVPELGVFLSIDELRFHDARSTLWGWPRQNPIRWRDPSGRDGTDDLIEFERLGGLDYLAGYGAGLLDNIPLYAGIGGPSLGDVSDALGLSGKHRPRPGGKAGSCSGGGGGGDGDDPADNGRDAGKTAGAIALAVGAGAGALKELARNSGFSLKVAVGMINKAGLSQSEAVDAIWEVLEGSGRSMITTQLADGTKALVPAAVADAAAPVETQVITVAQNGTTSFGQATVQAIGRELSVILK